MNSHVPLLTICLVTFNSGNVIERCIESLRKAVEKASVMCELWVVDNASKDDTVTKLRNLWPEAHITINPTNYGYARAINQATVTSQAEWLLFLNPDTVIPPDLFLFLQEATPLTQIEVFSPLLTGEDAKTVRTAYRWPTLIKELARLFGISSVLQRVLHSTQNPLPAREQLVFPEPIGEALVVDYVAGACLFIRRSTWNAIGPFDEHFFLYHEEMEWCWRAHQCGTPVFVLPACQAVHLIQQSSRERPTEVLVWKYQGLLHFYKKHRSRTKQLLLRGALVITFLMRMVFTAVLRRGGTDICMKLVHLAIRR